MNEAKVNILLVDDSPESLTALEDTLARLGQNMIKAHSGEEALKCLLKDEFAVILLDVRMPGMDGFETATLIQQREKSRHTPIIFLTGVSVDANHVFEGYSLGAVDYMLKPLVPEIVRAKVAVFIELFREREREKERRDRDRDRDKNTQLKIQRQKEKEQQKREQDKRDQEIRELHEALAAQKTLTGWDESSVTAGIAGVGSLRERDSETFAAIQTEYGLLLERYLKAVGLNDSPPRREISTLADRLGDLGVGPRDVIDLHMCIVTAKCKDIFPKRAKAYTVEGRLLALEVMGYLTDYYRMRTGMWRPPLQRLEPTIS